MASFVRSTLYFFLLFAVSLQVYGKPRGIREIVETRWNKRGQVVFLGDSITAGWNGNGRPTFTTYYEPLGTVNTGVSGDRTTTIIDRINNQGIINDLHAYLAVLKIGTNDLSGNVPEQTVADNIATILGLIKSKNPGVRILLLGVLPRTGEAIHTRIRTVNTLISSYANGNDVFFLNMEDKFSTALGTVIPELFTDGLHLTAAGYVKWAETMGPLFGQILAGSYSAKTVWLGDSLSSQWSSTGMSVWNQHYAALQSLNVAVSGHKTNNTLDLIERVGVLNDLNSKVAMLMIGGNDLQDGIQAPTIITNINRIIAHIREKIPHGRILLMGLLPAGGVPDWVIEEGKLVNDALALLENGDDLRYIDMRAQFADENENIHEELYHADRVHLSVLGYELWQRTIADLLAELLEFS